MTQKHKKAQQANSGRHITASVRGLRPFRRAAVPHLLRVHT